MQGLLPYSGPPGNHGNEDQERTLSCWRPEPGFAGGNEQRERGGGGGENCSTTALLNFTSHSSKEANSSKKQKKKLSVTGLVEQPAQLTVLESNSCLFCAKTFSTPACSAYVTNPKPLQTHIHTHTETYNSSIEIGVQTHTHTHKVSWKRAQHGRV